MPTSFIGCKMKTRNEKRKKKKKEKKRSNCRLLCSSSCFLDFSLSRLLVISSAGRKVGESHGDHIIEQLSLVVPLPGLLEGVVEPGAQNDCGDDDHSHEGGVASHGVGPEEAPEGGVGRRGRRRVNLHVGESGSQSARLRGELAGGSGDD